MYAPACPAQPPFSAAFVAAFRTAQIARNRRISAWAQNLQSRLRDRPDGDIERASVVHRTMCDVLCTMCDVLCTMCDVLCTMCDVLCTTFDVRCTMRRATCVARCDVRCTMYDVRWPNPHRRSERPSTKLVL